MKTRNILIGAFVLGIGGVIAYLVMTAKAISDLVGVKVGETWQYLALGQLGTVIVTGINGSVVTFQLTPAATPNFHDVAKPIYFAGTDIFILCAKGKSVGDDVGVDGFGNNIKFTSTEQLAVLNWGTRTSLFVRVQYTSEYEDFWYDKETGVLIKAIDQNGITRLMIQGAPNIPP